MDLKRLRGQSVKRRVRAAIEQIEKVDTLRKISGVRKLSVSGNYYRIRIGDYRLGLLLKEDTVILFDVCHVGTSIITSRSYYQLSKFSACLMNLKTNTLKINVMAYFEKEDILHLKISDDAERGSIELGPNITAELNGNGDLIGIEILNASAFIRDSILESVQAKILSPGKVPTA